MAEDFTKSTLNYPQGAPTPIRRVAVNRAPTTNDYKNFKPGDEWLDTDSTDWWKFVERNSGGALWVKIGGTSAAIETFNVDAATAPGTDPVVPNASNEVTVTGGQVAAGSTSNVIQTNSLAANSYTIQVQRSSAVGSTNADVNGVCHFDNSHFSVDGNGFVQLIGGNAAVDSFTPDTGTSPVLPNGTGDVSIRGQVTPNTSGIRVTGGTNALNISMFSPFEGDFAFTQSTNPSATPRRLVVSNTDTANAASDATIIMQTGGTSSGDPYNQYAVSTTRSWVTGADVSDSDNFKITTTNGSSLSPRTGTKVWQMTTGGIRTMPLQPAFGVFLPTDDTNVTGDGTAYPVGTNVGFTVDYDRNSDFTNGPIVGGAFFTAPVTGIYHFSVSAGFGGIDASMNNGQVYLDVNSATTNYLLYNLNYAAVRNGASNGVDAPATINILLNASDVVRLFVQIFGSTKTASIQGITGVFRQFYWSGFLIS